MAIPRGANRMARGNFELVSGGVNIDIDAGGMMRKEEIELDLI